MQTCVNVSHSTRVDLLQYGVPLDDRADITKTDWLMWVAAMGNEEQVRSSMGSILCIALATYIVQ